MPHPNTCHSAACKLQDTALTDVPTGELIWPSNTARCHGSGNYTVWSDPASRPGSGSIVPDEKIFPALVLRRVAPVKSKSSGTAVLTPSGVLFLSADARVSVVSRSEK